MAYKVKMLRSFQKSAFEADSNLYTLSPSAADKYYADYHQKIEYLRENPKMYQVFADDPYFRSAGLVYGYRLFYHVDDQNKTIILHRVIHGAMDLRRELQITVSSNYH